MHVWKKNQSSKIGSKTKTKYIIVNLLSKISNSTLFHQSPVFLEALTVYKDLFQEHEHIYLLIFKAWKDIYIHTHKTT